MKKYLIIFLVLISVVYFPKINGTSYIFSHLGNDYTEHIINEDEVLLQNDIDWNYPFETQVGFFNQYENSYYNKSIILDHQENIFNKLYYFETLSIYQTTTKSYQQKYEISDRDYLLIGYYVVDPYSQFKIKRPFLEFYENGNLEWTLIIDELSGEIVDVTETDQGYLFLLSHQKHYHDYSMAVYEVSFNGVVLRKYFFEGDKADFAKKILFNDNHFIILASTNSQTGTFHENNKQDFQVVAIYMSYPSFEIVEMCYFGNSGDDFPIDIILVDDNYYVLVRFEGSGSFRTDYSATSFYGMVHLSSRLELVSYYSFSSNLRVLGLAKQGEQIVTPCLELNGNREYLNYIVLSKQLVVVETVKEGIINGLRFANYLIKSSNQAIFIIEKVSSDINDKDIDYCIYAYFHASKEIFQEFFTLDGVISSIDFGAEVISICYYKGEIFKSIDALIIGYDKEENQVQVNGFIIRGFRINELDDSIFGLYNEYTKHQGFKTTIFTKRIKEVPFQTNIVGGSIYDLNTSIHFNGDGYLNDIKIESGYKIFEAGKYLLEVVGNNGKRMISFEVKKISQDIEYDVIDSKTINPINLHSNNNFQSEIEYNDFILPPEKGENTLFIILCGILISSILGFVFSKVNFKVNFKKFFIISGTLLIFFNFNFSLEASSKYLLFNDKIEYIEIIDQKYEGLIIKLDNKYYFTNNNLDIELPKGTDYVLEFYNNKYLIFYQENSKLKILEIDSAGKVYQPRILLEKVLNYSVSITNDGVYICGGLYDVFQEHLTLDAMIYLFDFEYEIIHRKIFEGTKNEWFEQIIILENELILIGYKDQLSGGEFGNGGKFSNNNLLICKLDSSFNVISLEVINTQSKILSWAWDNDNYYIVTTSEIIIVNNELIISKAIKLNDIFYAYIGNGLIITFDFTNVYSYHLDSLHLEFQELIVSKEEQIKRVIPIDNSFYVYLDNQQKKSLKQVDIVKISNLYPHFVISDFSLLPYENVKMKTAFQDLVLVNYFSTPYYERVVDGQYNFTLEFQIRNNKYISIDVPLEVSFECNVSNNRIYPLGYRLLFTGQAYLNKQEIFNNYQINKPGHYQLKLVNANNQETIIDFFVDSEQYHFVQGLYNKWDQSVFKGEQIIFSLKITKSEYENIQEICFKNEVYEKCEFLETEETLNIYFTAPQKEGLYVYFLEKIIYHDQEKMINKAFFVNVLKDKPSLKITSLDNLTFNIIIDDADKALRYLELKVISDNQEYLYQYSLRDQNLEFEMLDIKSDLLVIVSFAYDVGDNIIRTSEVLTLTISPQTKSKNFVIGSIEMIRSSSTIEELSLHIFDNKKNPITEITYNHQHYPRKVKNYQKIYGLVIGISLISLVVSYFMFRKKLKKK